MDWAVEKALPRQKKKRIKLGRIFVILIRSQMWSQARTSTNQKKINCD